MLEQIDVIEDDILNQISDAMRIPVEAFQNFDEEQPINTTSNTYSFQNFKRYILTSTTKNT